MRRPTHRTDSLVQQIQVHVPLDVVEGLRGLHISVDCPGMGATPETRITLKIGTTVKGSLRTRDPDVAHARRLRIIEHLERLYATARVGTVKLTHRQMVALAGEVYGLITANFDEDPGDMAAWAAWKGFVRAAREGRIVTAPSISPGELADERAEAARLFGPDLTAGIDALPPSGDRAALEDRCGRLTWWVLTRHGLHVDRETRLRLLEHVADACLDAGWAMKRAAGGDYTPDPKAQRFPEFQKPVEAGITLTDIFERWKRETKPAGSTLTTWKGILADFRRHLKHDDASRVTDQDVVAWKDSRIAAGRSLKTVADSDLACIRRLYAFALGNKLVSRNPAEGIKVAVKKKAGTGRLPYTTDDIARLLKHAEGERAEYRRWLPILLATTGARVGELAQLSADRVRFEDGVHVLRIEPASDGGSLKNEGSERTVPMHPALVESGFIVFARSKDGPLFYGSRPKRGARGEGEGRHASKSVANRLADWIRTLPGFDDPRKAPAHSGRHWWKTTAIRAGLADSVADHLQGHALVGVSGAYKHHHDDLRFLAGEVAKIPIPVPTPAKVEDDGAMPAEIVPVTGPA